VTVAGAIAAMSLRNLVHCALCLVLTFAGLAGLFLQLDAEFVGLVQILVYIGAVAILIVFAILLTRGGETAPPAPVTNSPGWGIAVAIAAFLALAGALASSGIVRAPRPPPAPPSLSVKAIGEKLMTDYVLPLEVIGLLLTAAMIGAVIIAMNERRKE
jgi:NADH-quinone oxidoreductase subunit J